MRLLLVFFLVVGYVLGQNSNQPITSNGTPLDFGLKKACEDVGGIFKQRENANAIIGDICTITFRVLTETDDDANEFCRLYAPWRLRSAIRNEDGGIPQTICEVEATMACDDGWIQMFGYCFRHPYKNKIFTQAEAIKVCSNLDGHTGEIAFLHHRYIVGVWKNYFRGIDQIWVNGSETWNQYVQSTGAVDGDALALALTGHTVVFSVFPNSLIRIDPIIRLGILCQYKPERTLAEIAYLGRRYSEIYHQSIFLEDGVLIRSASHYTRSKTNAEICQKTLRPFFVDDVEPFIPNDDIMSALSDQYTEPWAISNSGAHFTMDVSKRKSSDVCLKSTHKYSVAYPDPKMPPFVLPVETSVGCDNMNSVAIVHSEIDTEFRPMSDSQSVPVWCKFGRKMNYFVDLPKGYTHYERANGMHVGHKVVSMILPFDKAMKYCQDDGGAQLGGFNDKAEFEAIDKLISKKVHHWIGNRRRPDCPGFYFHSDPNHQCGHNKIHEWLNNVATEDIPIELWGFKQPDHAWKPQGRQECGSIAYGMPGSNGEPKLDDGSCEVKMPFICTAKGVLKATTASRL